MITGACGYVGTAFLHFCDRFEFLCIDRVYNAKIDELSDQFLCTDFNRLDTSMIKEMKKFSGVVVHLAAARSDDETEDIYFNDNVHATNNFLNALDAKLIKKIIHVGSVAAIDGEYLFKQSQQPQTSDDWYRYTKFEQQKLIEEWTIKNNVPLTILAPSAIYDVNAKNNSTNIGRLEKVISFLRVVPKIDVRKSLTSMDLLLSAIEKSITRGSRISSQVDCYNVDKFLVMDRPTQTITDICTNKFQAKIIIQVPYLKNLLLICSIFFRYFGLSKKIPLTRERVIKLYKDTDYKPVLNYKEWPRD